MKAHYAMFVALVSLGFLAGCSYNMMGSDDPNASFNDQIAAFENPALLPDDQLPPGYDTSSGDQYQTNSGPMYPADSDSDYASSDDQSDTSPRRSVLGSSGGGAEEVPFSETRRNKTSANVGAL